MAGSTRIFKALRRSVLQAIPILFVILVLNFFLLRLAPGDAADVMAGEQGVATAESMQSLRQLFGLDLSVIDQFFAYLNNLAHFTLGYSPRYGMQVEDLIAQRIPGSVLLMGVSLVFALGFGILAGSVMARFAGRLPDRILSVASLIFYSVPGFWFGLMLVILFSVVLGWLPSGGDQTIGADYTGFALIWDRVSHLILPAFSLSLFYIAIYARLTRAAMIEAQGQDYVRTAAAKGLSRRSIMFRHVLRNAMLPVSTMAGLHFGTLLGGSVVVETVFSWPGLGKLAYEAIMRRDYNVLLGILLISSVLVLVANIVTDLVQAWLDPRIEVR